MKEIDLGNGLVVVLVPEAERKNFGKTLEYSCRGCYFCTADALQVVQVTKLPSKLVRLDTIACEFPPNLDKLRGNCSCFYVPKDHYERFKPNERNYT